MAQTTQKSGIRLPKGAMVSAKKSGSGSWRDLGAIEADIAATLEWTDVEVNSGNADIVLSYKKDMKINGNFNLINLVPDGLEEISGGLFTKTITAASANTTIPDQVIAANWTDQTSYEMVAYTSSTDTTKLILSSKPTLTSVTLNHGTPETLTEDNDYVVVADKQSSSGWAIQFISANMSSGSPKTYSITINYGTNTPVATTTIHCGESSAEFAAYGLKFTVYADDAVTVEDELELYSTSTNSGAFNFGYKGANSDGVDSMPISFSAKVDGTKTSGQQLFAWTVKA